MALAKFYEQLKEKHEQHNFNHMDNKQVTEDTIKITEDTIKKIKDFFLVFDTPNEVLKILNQGYFISEITECEKFNDSILTALLKKHKKNQDVSLKIKMIEFFLSKGVAIDAPDDTGDNAIDIFFENVEMLDYFLNTYCSEDDKKSTSMFNAILYHCLTKKTGTEIMLTKLKKKRRPNRHVFKLMLESLDFEKFDKSLFTNIILDDELKNCIKLCVEEYVIHGEPQKAKSLYDFFYSK